MGELDKVQVTVTLTGPVEEVMRWLKCEDCSANEKEVRRVENVLDGFSKVETAKAAPVPVSSVEEPFPNPEPAPVASAIPAPTRGRRKAAAGQNDPVTPPAPPKVPAQTVEPGVGVDVAGGFPFEEPKPRKIQPSDMLDFHQIPDGATVTADFRFHTQEQFMKVVADVVRHIPDRNQAQQVVTDCGFKSIRDVTQDKYSDVIAGLLRVMYQKAGKTVHVETPSDNPLN